MSVGKIFFFFCSPTLNDIFSLFDRTLTLIFVINIVFR